jgi:hypothetical protein
VSGAGEAGQVEEEGITGAQPVIPGRRQAEFIATTWGERATFAPIVAVERLPLPEAELLAAERFARRLSNSAKVRRLSTHAPSFNLKRAPPGPH